MELLPNSCPESSAFCPGGLHVPITSVGDGKCLSPKKSRPREVPKKPLQLLSGHSLQTTSIT